MPLLQVFVVHGLLSLHWLAVVQAAQPVIGVVVQPLAGLQESVVQPLPSLQTSAVPARQAPALHVSAPLQALPSPHAVPLAAAGNVHMPLLQAFVVHGLLSLHWLDVVQLPPQPAIGVVVQPLAGLQESVVQLLPSLQTSAVPARQTPALHVSAPLQALPSLHAVPLEAAGNVHMPLLQVFVVHGLLSLHWPDEVQDAQPAIGVVMQPLDGLQESVVQLLPSLQTGGVPARHTPALHVSVPLQALPSPQVTCAQEQPLVLTAAPDAVPSQVSG
jgi:hypothetical protein